MTSPDTHAAATLHAALAYAERGWHVFPLAPGSKRPAVKDWEHAATTDPRPIRAWFSPILRTPFGLGIACGPSRLVVLDLDHKPHLGISWRDGWTILRALGDLTETHLTRTHTVQTPSGGWHLYYAAPDSAELRNTQSRLGPGIDTRAHGGYVAAPPTRLPNGAYTFTLDAGPGQTGGLAALPGWLAHALHAPEPPPTPAAPITLHTSTSTSTSTGTSRATRYLDAAVNAETARVRDAQPGTRNHALFIAAVALGQLAAGGEIPADTVHAVLLDACAGHLADGAFTRAEADNTIRSGLKRGATRPRRIAA